MSKTIGANKYKSRIIDEKIKFYISTFGAVCIDGPKWCGKTSSASLYAKSEINLSDPKNNFNNRQLAQISSDLVLGGKTPRLIKEWWEVPLIRDAVRRQVDMRGKKGQFILTGCSRPPIKGVTHSGAGRIGSLRMRTMSLYESGDSTGTVSLKELCNGIMKEQAIEFKPFINLGDLIVRGGYPEVIGLNSNEAQGIIKKYINEILEVNLKFMDGKRHNINKILLLLKSLARNEGKLVSKRKLGSDIKETENEHIDYDTLCTYLDLLERVFILDNQDPFTYRIRSLIRRKQMTKYHLCDPSLVCALLDLSTEKLYDDIETFERLFKNLCIRDLKVYAESFDADVYHYMDYSNMKADVVIDFYNDHWCAFEIVLGTNQLDKAAKKLLKLKEIAKHETKREPSVLCIICGFATTAYRRLDGVYVVPITSLKD